MIRISQQSDEIKQKRGTNMKYDEFADTFQIGDIIITQRNRACISNPRGLFYESDAEDENGNEYQIVWQLKEGYDPLEQEEEDACDWSNPYLIIPLENEDRYH